MGQRDEEFSGLSYDELVHRANSGFPWHWEHTEVANEKTRIAVASDPDGMLLDACRRQDAGEEGVIDPFWATTWRAASGLDRYLNRINLQNQQFLEVGCGTGHVGLSAALRGDHVTLTEGVTDPLLLVHLSTWNVRERCSIQRLRFGIDTIDSKFPIILGSDVTYLRQLWPELLQCLKDHLAPGGVVFLSDPFRIIANEFSEWIQNQKNWCYSESSIALPDDKDHPIRVMKLTIT